MQKKKVSQCDTHLLKLLTVVCQFYLGKDLGKKASGDKTLTLFMAYQFRAKGSRWQFAVKR